jgi:hypothetical protein
MATGGRNAVGRSSNTKPPSRSATPRSSHVPFTRCSSCTGMASSTSLPTTTPDRRSGSSSTQETLSANAARRSCCRCRRLPRGRRWCSVDAIAQRFEQLLRERAGAGAELPHGARAGDVQRLRHLARERAAEQRREFGRGHEVAAGRRHRAELARRVGVVAQPGRVQGQRHEAIERQPAAVAGDRPTDQRREGARYTACIHPPHCP